MRIKVSFILLTVLSILCHTDAVFSQKTDFTGNWEIREKTSVSGVLYENGVPKQIKTTQNPEIIIIEKINTNQSGLDYTTADTVSLNGKVSESITPQKRKKSIMIKWSDETKVLTQTSNFSYPDNENNVAYTITDIWKLSESGESLMLLRTMTSPKSDGWSIKAVYNKR
jgi:hypothetical protein